MSGAEWIAVDWGSSNLRVWAMNGDGVLGARESAEGTGRLDRAGFEPALLRLVGDWLGEGRTSVIVCGMAGSREGWAEAAYAPVPTMAAGSPTAVTTADPRLSVRILSGVSQATPPDVMRGEETQVAGLLAHDPEFDGVVCLPGTHTKWVRVSAGELCHFRTLMTGELFALLTTQSVLRHSLQEDGWDGDAFEEGLAHSLSRPESLGAELFGIRAAHLLEGRGAGIGRARLSGLLMGIELAATRPYWLGQRVAVIGAADLAVA